MQTVSASVSTFRSSYGILLRRCVCITTFLRPYFLLYNYTDFRRGDRCQSHDKVSSHPSILSCLPQPREYVLLPASYERAKRPSPDVCERILHVHVAPDCSLTHHQGWRLTSFRIRWLPHGKKGATFVLFTIEKLALIALFSKNITEKALIVSTG